MTGALIIIFIGFALGITNGFDFKRERQSNKTSFYFKYAIRGVAYLIIGAFAVGAIACLCFGPLYWGIQQGTALSIIVGAIGTIMITGAIISNYKN